MNYGNYSCKLAIASGTSPTARGIFGLEEKDNTSPNKLELCDKNITIFQKTDITLQYWKNTYDAVAKSLYHSYKSDPECSVSSAGGVVVVLGRVLWVSSPCITLVMGGGPREPNP